MTAAAAVPALDDEVRFADVEQALKDQRRFKWIAPLIDGTNDIAADGRARAVFECWREGLRGLELIDEAMTRCPT